MGEKGMKYIITILLIIFCSLNLYSETTNNLSGTSTVQAVDENITNINLYQDYIEILEAYIQNNYQDVLSLTEIFLDQYPNTEYQYELKKLTNKITNFMDQSPQTLKIELPGSEIEEKSRNSLFYYWARNLIEITGAMNLYPVAFQVDNAETFAAVNLLGIGASVATSLLSTKGFEMSWGRVLAIDFYSTIVAFHTEALLRSFLYPNQSDAYNTYLQNLSSGINAVKPPISSFFPNALNNEDYLKTTFLSLATATLAARYTGIITTANREPSLRRYSLLMNGYTWATLLSMFTISEIDGRGVTDYFPNAHNLLFSGLIGDAAIWAIDKFRDRIDWSVKKIWLTSLSGGIVGGLGPVAASTGNEWDLEHMNLYAIIYSLSGLTMGYFATENSTESALFQISGYTWASMLSISFLSEVELDFNLPWMVGPAIGNIASYFSYKHFDKLNWTTGHTLLVNLGGAIGMLMGVSVDTLVSSQWISDHYPVYNAIWTIAGLASFTFFTRNMPTVETEISAETSQGYEKNTYFSVIPYPDEQQGLGLKMNLTLNF